MSPRLSNTIALAGDDLEQAAADNLQWLVQECGVTPQKISELLRDLPDPAFSDRLVDYYFSSMYVIVYVRPFLTHRDVEIGRGILFPRPSFVRLIHRSALAFRTAQVLQTHITSVFYPFYSWCLQYL